MLASLLTRVPPANAADGDGGCASFGSSFPSGPVEENGVAFGLGCARDAGSLRSLAGSDGDVVLAISFGVVQRPDQWRQKITQVVETTRADMARGWSLSQALTVRSEPNSVSDDEVVFDGAIHAVGDSVVIVVPAGELATTGFWDAWWKKMLAGAAGIAAAVVSFGLCSLAFAPAAPLAAPVCGAVAGALQAGVPELVSAALDGKPIDAEVWGATVAQAMWGAALGAAGGALLEYVAAGSFNLMSSTRQMVLKLITIFTRWRTPLEFVANLLNGNTAQTIINILQRLQRGVGGAQVRLMPLGDSITYGVGSSTGDGYRAPLWSHLEQTASSLDFVGSVRAGTMPDGDNQGHSGYRIDEIDDIADCSVPSSRPNVVTLHAGTNDLNQNYQVSAAPARLGALISQVLDDAPEATVLVANLVPATKPGLQAKIDTYNAALPSVIKGFRDQGKHVALVDMSAVTIADLAQPAHPNDTGYRKMAAAFLKGIADAAANGWLTDPRTGTGTQCGAGQQTNNAGPGWNSLGVIAPGMSTPAGRTDIVELNGDNRGDYVRITDDGTVRAALNTPGEPGKPNWVDQGIIVSGAEGKIWFADINGDGRDDLIRVVDNTFSSETDIMYGALNTGPASDGWFKDFQGQIATPFAGATHASLRFADVDGDGRDDYLRVGESAAVHAYLNKVGGNGFYHWVEWLNWAPGVWYGSRNKLRLADVNGDRRADYLMVGSTGEVHAYFNDGGGGNGGFTEHLEFVYETGYPGDKSTFRDISGDGKADYVVIYDGGSVLAWLNRGGNL